MEEIKRAKVTALYRVCHPDMPLDIGDPLAHRYYIDFSPVREGQAVDKIYDQIALWNPHIPTCQLFTGHMGCGKSTELLTLGSRLRKEGFHVVHFESDKHLEMGDLGVVDILILMARQVIREDELRDMIPQQQISAKQIREYIAGMYGKIEKIVNEVGVPIPGLETVGISIRGIVKIFGDLLKQAKDSPDFRGTLREHLDPDTNRILEAINQELIEPVVSSLKKKGKKGLVIIVDGMDRMGEISASSGKAQSQNLFIDRGEQLKLLKCHVVYTFPFGLIFSTTAVKLKHKFDGYYVLPMIPVRHNNGDENQEGMELLRQMVLTRAFPYETARQRLERITEIFDTPETLDALCQVSGGHARNLMVLFQDCIKRERHLPISSESLAHVVQKTRNDWRLGVLDVPDGWELLRKVRENKMIQEHRKYYQLLQNLFVLEYRDPSEGSWFEVNPILKDAKELNP
ncbi:MAG: hypothetical protein B6245_17580 [Desulfobacteraceae bacterium 4572_88]|nr:MAG: hypothetical protein B6245_17580 [Desulfobacteraceae bacterium 4572_88]